VVERHRGFRIEFLKAALDVPGAIFFEHGGIFRLRQLLQRLNPKTEFRITLEAFKATEDRGETMRSSAVSAGSDDERFT
jgi:hypothetical protein